MNIRFPTAILLAAALAIPVFGEGVPYPAGTRAQHFTFQGSPGSDQPIIRPPAAYLDDDGYGFVDSSAVRGEATGAEAPEYLRFDVKLPDGNYDVSLLLGNPSKETDVSVKAEAHRGMATNIHTNPRQAVTVNFTVNVHTNKLLIPIDTDGRLTVEVVGKNPSLMKYDVKPNDTAATVYIAGDSTACDWDDPPWSSWGDMLPLMFKPGTVAVADRASSGRSSKSFIDEKRLADILDTMKQGDYLLIQFGHNDQKTDEARHTDPETTFKSTLQIYIDEARKRGATPILVTPMPRRNFTADGKIENTLGDYPKAIRELAAADKVALIDLNAEAGKFYEALGPDKSKTAFLFYPPGTFPNHKEELKDNTHFNSYGAYELAKIIAHGIQQAGLPLAQDLTDIPPQNLDAGKQPVGLDFNYLMATK
ncbi:MAG TPA: rhamnogalacturonan acetylesterase [Phycisphaerae bacterium]|nr:rhamnogalacturonan acetylesterase [Phycisphaerae bacterium]